MSGNVKTGTVKWFNDEKGYGFIRKDDGQDIFVHYKSISMNGRRTLKENQKVEFTEAQGQKGLQASDVVVVGE
jgi:CspA family cold shock protein